MGCFVFFRSRFSCVGKREGGGGRRGSGKRRGELCGGCEQQERGDSRRRKRRGKREREEVASGAERNKCCRDVMKKVIARWPAKKNRKSFNRLSQAAPQSAAVVAGALSRTMAETKLCPNRRCATFNEPRKRQNGGNDDAQQKKTEQKLTPLGAAQQQPPNFALRGPPFCFIVGVPPEPLKPPVPEWWA